MALPAHEVVASADVVVGDGDLQLVGLVVVHVQVELLQPARTQRLRLVLQQRRRYTACLKENRRMRGGGPPHPSMPD